MFKSYLNFCNETQTCTKEKLKHVVLGQAIGNDFLYCVIAYLLYMVLIFLYTKLFVLYLIVLCIVIVYIYATRFCTVGVTKDSLVIVKFTRFRGDIKRIYEVPFDEIKYFDYKKRIFNHLDVSFFSKNGDFVKCRIRYARIHMGLGGSKYSEDVKGLDKIFAKKQKEIDKGDF